jgi:hypothetical protein
MEVAVGTPRLASMFSTMRTAPPRMGVAMSPGRMTGTMSDLPARSRATGAAWSWRTSVVVRAGRSAVASWARSVTGPWSWSGATPIMRSK